MTPFRLRAPRIANRVVATVSGLILAGIPLLMFILPSFDEPGETVQHRRLGDVAFSLAYTVLLFIPYRWAAASRPRFIFVGGGLLVLSAFLFLATPPTFLAIFPPLNALDCARNEVRLRERIRAAARLPKPLCGDGK